ncbi:hypothetical protein P691DRAFT_513449 [Macrolepiota fuliginosa MF-IS2]|uniref:Uncharacterized protein n=1 Tax=Macrolepiota fuliginosa MF-IS2 TaxID=1400762 RepID=A0A9P5X377_9AGAR|nr:hypothetical protein P691DRAFT_513449 [Macrolepiota fuliginosa MF-IS2]
MPRNLFQRLFNKSLPEDPTAVNLHLQQEATQLINRHIDDIFTELNRNMDNSLRERYPPHFWANSGIQSSQPGFGNGPPVFPQSAPMNWQQPQVVQSRVPVPPVVYMPYNEQPRAPPAPHIGTRGERRARRAGHSSTSQPDLSESEASPGATRAGRRTDRQSTQHNLQPHIPAAPGTANPHSAWPFVPRPVPSGPAFSGPGGPGSLVTNLNLPRPSDYVPPLHPIPLPAHDDPITRFREGFSSDSPVFQPQSHAKPPSYQKLKRWWFGLPIVASPLPMSEFRGDIPLPQIGDRREGNKDGISVPIASLPFVTSTQAREGASGPWFGDGAVPERRDSDIPGIKTTVRKVASTSTIRSAPVSETDMRDSVPYYIATLAHITNLIEGCKFQLGREIINQERGRPGLQISLHQLGSIVMYRRQYGTLTDYDEVEKLKL